MREYKEEVPQVVMPDSAVAPLLEGQCALVTGANSGIGEGIALALAAAGAAVLVNYVTAEAEAEQVAEAIRSAGGRAFTWQADVSDERQVKAMFERLYRTFGTIDILVNNAGIQRDAAFEEMTVSQWNEVLKVNLTGQFLCAREAVCEFKRRGVRPDISCSAGKIICVSSVHEIIPWAGHANYAASKGGVQMLMKTMAQELARYRIRVVSISPGAIKTSINRAAWQTPQAYAELMKLIPYQRMGEPADIGRVAVWLASDQADYISGTSIYVDGGMLLYPGFEAGG